MKDRQENLNEITVSQQDRKEDQRCELAKVLGDGLDKMIKQHSTRVKEFLLEDLLQDPQPDRQRLEIEEVARVIVTPLGVEIYTFDDHVYFIEFVGTKVNKMKLVESFEKN